MRNLFIGYSSRRIMLIREGLIYLSLTVWLMADVEVEAYKSGCSGGYCFVISDISNNNENLDQSNAQHRCRSNGTQLVEIRNKDIQNALINFIRNVYSQGLNGWSLLTNGKRSSSGSGWIRLNGNGIGSSLRLYDQTDSSFAYGYLKSTTSGFDLFASRPEDTKTGFICTGLSDCSGGVTISGQCYKGFSVTLSWYDARNRCLDGGGDLASFEHITTNAGFKALNGSWLSTSNSYWIGIRRESWTWQSSNSDVKYSEWLNGHPVNNADCLCLSSNSQWKWTECNCYQQWPFVCFLENSTTSNIPAVSTKTTSPTNTSPTFASGASTSADSGVFSPTVPPTATSRSTQDASTVPQSRGLSREATIGIAVGVGVGGALVITAMIAAAIILCRKRCPVRYPQKKPPPPDILIRSYSSCHEIENPYATVVSSSPDCVKADTNATESHSQSPIVYAPLEIFSEPQIHRDAIGSVIIVPGKTGPSSSVSSPSGTTRSINHFKVEGDLYAEITKA